MSLKAEVDFFELKQNKPAEKRRDIRHRVILSDSDTSQDARAWAHWTNAHAHTHVHTRTRIASRSKQIKRNPEVQGKKGKCLERDRYSTHWVGERKTMRREEMRRESTEVGVRDLKLKPGSAGFI